MTREELESCWKDQRNWKWGIIYNCKADPRVVVPKQKWFGWTINFGRPSAHPTGILLSIILFGPYLIVAYNGGGTGVRLLTFLLDAAVDCILCAYLASRTK